MFDDKFKQGYRGIIKYPQVLESVAVDLGNARCKLNNELRSHVSRYQRDNPQNIDRIGILGELIVQYHLISKNIKYKAASLIDLRPAVEPDIVCGQYVIDVKGVPDYLKYLSVNEEAHKKKTVGWYWFIKMQDVGVSASYVYSWEAVNAWEVRKLKYSNAYCLDIK